MAPAAVAFHADRELVWKVPDRVVVAFTEDEMGVLVLLQAGFQSEGEVGELVLLGPEPGVAGIGEDGIQQVPRGFLFGVIWRR